MALTSTQMSTATAISRGTQSNKSISTTGETDVYKVTLSEGGSYSFSTVLGTLSDSTLRLYDASGNQVLYDDDGSVGLASLIEFEPSTSGVYYLEVAGYSGSYTGSYNLVYEADNSGAVLTGNQTNFTAVTSGSNNTFISKAQLLAGYTDPDGDTLTIVGTPTVSAGSLTATTVDGVAGYRFTAPTTSTTTSVTFNYQISDGHDNVVNASNNISVANASPQIIVSSVDRTTGEDGDTAAIRISLATDPTLGSVPDPDAVVTFTLTTSDASEARFYNSATNTYANTATVTLNHSNFSTGQTVTLKGIQDFDNDADVAFSVNVVQSGDDGNLGSYFTLARDYSTTLNFTNEGDKTATGADRDVPVYLIGDDGRPQEDQLVGNDGADRLYGGYMVDRLSGSNGNDRVYGGYEDDFIYGDAGDDRLYGEQDDDFLYGGAGNDRLDGGIGEDYMEGGAGNDTYYVTLSDDGAVEDTIIEAANAGTDTVYIPFQVESYIAPNNVEVIRMNAGFGDTSVTGNASNNTIVANAGDNMLDGGSGNDSLNGGAGNDVLLGGVGADRIDGGIGNDEIIAGVDNDIVLAGVGNDEIAGGAGRDSLTGGTGSDDFNFTAITDTGTTTATADRITDLSTGDEIDLSALDANTTVTGNQAFTFAANMTSWTAGSVYYNTTTDYMYINTDTDVTAEAVIFVGTTTLTTWTAATFSTYIIE